jgi:hypothetical protein
VLLLLAIYNAFSLMLVFLVSSKTAGGCTNTERVKDTPQYALSFDEPCTIGTSAFTKCMIVSLEIHVATWFVVACA